ncbi:Ig-like domain-containing protein [Pseudomonas aeruginosa]|uniref:Ig-like domain-containing protein n=1 Tax=Pseudomonas aeruginosa TaxID=287 RepID=UPI002363E55A|nr:Ig-like domain-containing protein [Pseudomonas aeruginosa]MDD1820362.1 Ig-like domain-containing protein [Pseudomonas aeruginosa]
MQLKDAAGNAVGAPVTLNAQGKGELQVPPTLSGQEVAVTQTVGGVESLPSAGIEVPLLKPTLGVPDANTGTVAVSGKPGASVQLQDKEGNPVGSPVTLNAQGQGVIQIPPSLSGQVVTVIQKLNDLQSPPSDGVSIPLLKPTVLVDADSGELLVSGKPNASVQLLDKNNNPIGSPVQLDAQGQAVIKLPHSLGGESVGVVAQEAGGTSAVSTLELPLLAPVFGEVDALSGQVSVEGKPEGIVRIEKPDGTFIRVPLDENGKGSVILPSSVSSENLEATVRLGNLESVPGALAVPVLAPRGAAINDTGSTVTVKAKPGEIIKVRDAGGKELGSGVVGKDGSVEIALSTPQKTGAPLSVTAHNQGEVSPTVTVVTPFIDADLPLPPTELSINPAGTRVLGKAKPGETIKIVNLDTKEELGTFPVAIDGFFSADIAAQKSGSKLAITAIKGEKSSEPALLLIPLSGDETPAKPYDVVVDVTGTKVQGKGTPNTIVLIKTEDNKTVIAKGIVGANGTFEVTIASQPGGTLLSVALQNRDKVSESEEVVTPHIVSNTPTDVRLDESGTQVTGKGNKGDVIRVENAQGKEIGSGVVKPDGTFVVTIPKQPADTTLAVTAQGNGAESAPAFVKTPATEVERPPQPEAHLNATGTLITGKTQPGANVSVKDATGKLLAGPVQANADGTFEATIARQPAGSKVAVVAEVAGKESLPNELIAPQVGEGTPPAPVSAQISADGKLVSGKAAPNTKVVVKDASGNSLGEQLVDADGNYVVSIKAQMGGATLGVTSTSLDGKLVSPSVSVLAPFQLVAEHHEETVSQFIDPNFNQVEDKESTTFVTPFSSLVSGGLNLITGLFGGGEVLPTSATYYFSVSKSEKVEITVNSSAPINVDLVNFNGVKLEKLVDGKWVDVRSSNGGGLGNLSVLPIIATKSGVQLKYETPGEYRVTVNNFDVLGVGTKTYTTEIVKTSFVGGVANSAISNNLVLPVGAKLLKVNETTLANEVLTIVPGKYGQLSIGTDGQARYQQDHNATPSDQTETFTYEARTADGSTLTSTFNISIKAYSVSGDAVTNEEASIVSINGKSLSATNQETIVGKFGDLKIKANGEYTYTPKLSLTGLNETETFTYQVKHKNGETVTSTLEVKIADSKLVAELDKVATGPTVTGPDLATAETAPESLVGTEVADQAELPQFNLAQGQKLDTSKLVSLQSKDDPSKAPLTVTLNDILQPDGSLSKPISASTLDLPDSWKPDGRKESLNGHEYLHYIDEATKKDLWVESGVSVV